MAGRPSLLLKAAARTSPTLWSHMHLCRLRAAFSTSAEADNWVLHSPRAWLGTAFHQLMLARPADETEAGHQWDVNIGRLSAKASAHRLDARFSKPERWPGYYLVRQRAIASAVRSRPKRQASEVSAPPRSGTSKSEILLTARAGRLAGRPDHFDRLVVTEYKSAFPDPTWKDAESIYEGYWRQLRLYAVLIGETHAWPSIARIVAASGQVLERQVDRLQCETEADAAVAGLMSMNRALEPGKDCLQLADPGEISCGQCLYQAICPAFWNWCAKSEWPQLRERAARGTLEAIDPGVDDDLYAVTLSLAGRQGDGGPQTLALRKSVHGDLTACAIGIQVRVICGTTRPDGRLRADIGTCVFSEEDLPEVKCGESA